MELGSSELEMFAKWEYGIGSKLLNVESLVSWMVGEGCG